MAKTIIINEYGVDNDRKKHRADVAETSYSAGGVSVSAAEVALGVLESVQHPSLTDRGYTVRWNKTTKKFMIFFAGGHVTELLQNIKGGESGAQATGSNTTDPVNGAYVIALVTATTAAKSTIAANPDVPRNVIVQLRSATGGTLAADCGTCTVVGTDQFDQAVTEAVSLAALNGVTLSAGGEVWVVGTKIFKTVTSATLSINHTASIADAQVSIGLGTKLGLRGKIRADADIKRVLKNDTAIAAATYVEDTTYHAVDMAADLADNDDVYIEYASTTEVEVPDATNIGTIEDCFFRGF